LVAEVMTTVSPASRWLHQRQGGGLDGRANHLVHEALHAPPRGFGPRCTTAAVAKRT
jgi:hypothetical protein